MPVELHDSVPISGVRRTEDGYLVADVKVARTGIQTYRGSEVGMPDRDFVRVYRPEEEVFAKDSLNTYAHRPVTMGHPEEPVTADNWKTHAVGQTGGEVARDGDMVRVPMAIMDSESILQVFNGERELSMGYMSELEFTDGKTPAGEPYDAIQRSLRMNHLAVVAKARGGSELKIGDNNSGGGPMPGEPTKTRTVLVDGLSVETTDAGAQAIEKLQKQLTDAESAHKTVLADKDKEIATKDGEIDKLKKQVLDAAAIDRMVADRADLIAKAKKIHPEVKTDGLSAGEIRSNAVKAIVGDSAIEGRSPEYIEARFDVLADSANDKSTETRDGAGGDPLKNGIKPNTQHADGGWGDVLGSAGLSKKEG